MALGFMPLNSPGGSTLQWSEIWLQSFWHSAPQFLLFSEASDICSSNMSSVSLLELSVRRLHYTTWYLSARETNGHLYVVAMTTKHSPTSGLLLISRTEWPDADIATIRQAG